MVSGDGKNCIFGLAFLCFLTVKHPQSSSKCRQGGRGKKHQTFVDVIYEWPLHLRVDQGQADPVVGDDGSAASPQVPQLGGYFRHEARPADDSVFEALQGQGGAPGERHPVQVGEVRRPGLPVADAFHL